MILYHGSNVKIDKVDLSKCRKYKDFGQGFYCTTIKQQAEFMARRTTTRAEDGSPCVSSFELDEKVFYDKDIKIRKFDKPSKEWAEFILNNRDRNFKDVSSLECNFDNKYDLVIGPVADDDIIVLFRTFVRGLINIDTLIKELTYKELTDQYSFHTEKALKYLKGVK